MDSHREGETIEGLTTISFPACVRAAIAVAATSRVPRAAFSTPPATGSMGCRFRHRPRLNFHGIRAGLGPAALADGLVVPAGHNAGAERPSRSQSPAPTVNAILLYASANQVAAHPALQDSGWRRAP